MSCSTPQRGVKRFDQSKCGSADFLRDLTWIVYCSAPLLHFLSKFMPFFFVKTEGSWRQQWRKGDPKQCSYGKQRSFTTCLIQLCLLVMKKVIHLRDHNFPNGISIKYTRVATLCVRIKVMQNWHPLKAGSCVETILRTDFSTEDPLKRRAFVGSSPRKTAFLKWRVMTCGLEVAIMPWRTLLLSRSSEFVSRRRPAAGFLSQKTCAVSNKFTYHSEKTAVNLKAIEKTLYCDAFEISICVW